MITAEERRALLDRAITTYGAPAQMDMAVEEMADLTADNRIAELATTDNKMLAEVFRRHRHRRDPVHAQRLHRGRLRQHRDGTL